MIQTSTVVHIFVEVDREKQVKLEFHTDHVTGREIKERAGIPLDNELARRQDHKLELVTNDQVVEIKNGEHFISLPPGSIS